MNLAQWLLARIEQGGYTPEQVTCVRWNTSEDYIDGDSWVVVDRGSFIAAASQVQAAQVPPAVRGRIMFEVVADGTSEWYRWDGTDFARVARKPRIMHVTAAMLRGEG